MSPAPPPVDGVIVAEGELVLRRMRPHDDDFSLLVEWTNRPHVRRWWEPDLYPATLESVREEYGRDAAEGRPSTPCIVELEGRPVGFIQFYRWSAYAAEATEVGIPFDYATYGLDVFIGEPELTGHGLGTRLVALVSDFFLDELGASAVALTTDCQNHAAQRCYEKAGFQKVRRVLDTDTYMGERVESWLMIKRRTHGATVTTEGEQRR